jgi:hypothetical protein
MKLFAGFDKCFKLWAASVVGGMIAHAKSGFGWTVFVLSARVCGVVASTFDAAWRMMAIVCCVTVVLVVYTLGRTTVGPIG